jgi:hypothetical protein
MTSLNNDKRIWVGTSTTKAWLSWLIRLFTGKHQSHAWISWWDEVSQQRIVAEATGKGFHLLSWKRWKHLGRGKRIWVYSFDVDLTLGIRRVTENLGTPYDTRTLLWHALHKLFKFWFKNPLRSPNTYICSEAAVYVLQYSNVRNSAQLDPDGTNPGVLTEWCQNSDQSTVVIENFKL